MPTSPKRRMTSQRRIILEELRKTKAHPTADELYTVARKRLPKISLGTVYRNLEQLAESGEILKLEMCGCQKRFDGSTHEHFHARCQVCGRVIDVDAEIPHTDLDRFKADDFEISGLYMELIGTCASCGTKG
jgi:Fur family transcriptional regulator, ferric uptake regulator